MTGFPAPVFVMCCIGMSAYWLWIRITLFSFPVLFNAGSNQNNDMLLINIMANTLVLAVLFALAKRIRPILDRKLLLYVAVLCIAAGTGLMSLSQFVGLPYVLLAGGVAMAAGGTGCVLCFWSEIFARIRSNEPRFAIIIAGESLSVVFYLITLSVPSFAALIIASMLPFISAYCILDLSKRLKRNPDHVDFLDPDKECKSVQLSKPFPMSFLLYCLFFSIPLGMYRGSNLPSQFALWSPVIGGALMLLMVLILVSYIVKRKLTVLAFTRTIAPLMAAGLLLLSSIYIASSAEIVAGVLIFTGHFLYVMYVYMEMSTLATKGNPVRIFALGTIAVNIGWMGGILVGHFARSSSEPWSLGIVLGIVFLIFICGYVYSFRHAIYPAKSKTAAQRGIIGNDIETPIAQCDHSVVEASDSSGEADLLSSSFEVIDRAHQAIARRYLLTAREEEVMIMLARGYNIKYISEKLVLSPNTIKSHVSNIYRKLAIHSRSELLSLTEEERSSKQ